MARWLFKQEPDCYSFGNLEKDGETIWDGVANPLARKHLRAAQVGDQVLFYHTGKEKSVIGVMEIVGAADGDSTDALKVRFVKRLPHPVTLAAIKADPAFADWELVRQSRLSVMPVSDALWNRVVAMAGGESKASEPAAAEKPAKEVATKTAVAKAGGKKKGAAGA